MRGVQRVSTKGMSREEWLMRRRKTIGGSDAVGIVGLSRWASPFLSGQIKPDGQRRKRTPKPCGRAGIWRTM